MSKKPTVLTSISQRLDSRQAVFDYQQKYFGTMEYRWRSDIHGDYIELFTKTFGRRHHTVLDSARRRLSVWYVDTWEIPFWIISHRHRGTTYEVLPSATDEQCVALVERIGMFLKENVSG